MGGSRIFLVIAALAASAALPAAAQTGPAKQEREAAAPAGQLSPVGQGERMGRKPLPPGAYITARHRPAAEAWLARHRPGARGAAWEIGTPLPRGKDQAAPADLLALLPPTPPGLRYLLTGDAVLLVAKSGMVVDAVTAPSSSPR